MGLEQPGTVRRTPWAGVARRGGAFSVSGAAGAARRRAEMEHPADRHAEHRDRKRRPRMPMHGAALRKPEMSGGLSTKKKPRRRRKK